MIGRFLAWWTGHRVEFRSMLERHALPGARVLVAGPVRPRDIVEAADRIGDDGQIIIVHPDIDGLETVGRMARKKGLVERIRLFESFDSLPEESLGLTTAILVPPAGASTSFEVDLCRAWQGLGPGGQLIVGGPDARALDEVLRRASSAGFDGVLRVDGPGGSYGYIGHK